MWENIVQTRQSNMARMTSWYDRGVYRGSSCVIVTSDLESGQWVSFESNCWTLLLKIGGTAMYCTSEISFSSENIQA
jgi:hypothetical protein